MKFTGRRSIGGISGFTKLGELAGQLLKKGSAVQLEGRRLKTQKWSDDTGVNHGILELSAV